MRTQFSLIAVGFMILALLAVLAGCNNGGTTNQTTTTVANANTAGTPPQVNPPVVAASTTVTQVEQLARPAINEGLLLTNAFLNAYNSIPPSQQATALGGPVGTELQNVLKALGNTASNIAAIAGALIPDEMRIDTTITSGYAGGVTFTGAPFSSDISSIPAGGRLIMDDVIDITLKLLTHNPAATDNVNYAANPGNFATGHQPLSTTFPYLAPPN